MVKGRHNQPPNIATFHVSMEMTKHDIKNYLEKIYKIPVVSVRTEISIGNISFVNFILFDIIVAVRSNP